MNAPAKIRAATDPAMIEFVQALARAQVARDIAAVRAARGGGPKGDSNADGHLRTL